MTRVYLVRHAEAEGNIYRRAQGQYDSGVSAKGQRQIAALAERFRDTPIDALYSSDLRRTRQTADAILRCHPALELHLDPRLREVALGPWEDRPFGDLLYQYPEQMMNFNDDPGAWQVEGAERFAHLAARIRGAVEDIAARHDGQTVVCVSHGLAIRALLADLLGVPSPEIYKVPHGDNTAVALLEYADGVLTPVYYNDASHLPASLSTFARQSWWKERGKLDLNNVRFSRLDPDQEPERYLDFYRKTWLDVHGDLTDFSPAPYLAAARRHYAADPDSIVTITRVDGQVVGITELDTLREADAGAGWIVLCYIEPDCRRAQLGAQLIGHAVSLFRRLGRKKLRLCVYEGNTGAIAFYTEFGFTVVGEMEGVSTRLLVMEKEL